MTKIIDLLLCIFLSCCTTRYSRPYSAKKVEKILNEKYHQTEIAFVKEEELKPSPYAVVRYTFIKKPEGFNFAAVVAVKSNPHFPTTNIYVSDDYLTALVSFYTPQAMELADKYHIRLGTSDRTVDGTSGGTVIAYIHDPKQFKNVTKLYFDLRKIYRLNPDRITDIWYLPQFDIRYLPKHEVDTKKSIGFLHASYDFEKDINEEIFFESVMRNWINALNGIGYYRLPGSLLTHFNENMGINDMRYHEPNTPNKSELP